MLIPIICISILQSFSLRRSVLPIEIKTNLNELRTSSSLHITFSTPTHQFDKLDSCALRRIHIYSICTVLSVRYIPLSTSICLCVILLCILRAIAWSQLLFLLSKQLSNLYKNSFNICVIRYHLWDRLYYF